MDVESLAAPDESPPPFALEDEYQAVMSRLRRRPGRLRGVLILVGSLALFILFQVQQQSATGLRVGILVGVLFFHELGHYVGMRAFGWRDVRMFFIPFLGAAVSGKRRGGATWLEGIVLLLGPVPGIAVGVAIAMLIRTGGAPWQRSVATTLIYINAFNLLPLAALDGGKVLQLTLFQRHRLMEVAFVLIATTGLVLFSLQFGDKLLMYVGFALLGSIPLRYRLLEAAHALRGRLPPVPPDARDLDDVLGRELFVAAREATTAQSPTETRVAAALESLVELLSRAVPSSSQTGALVAVWMLSFAASAGGLWLLNHSATSWREVRDPEGRYTVWFPAEPTIGEQTVTSALGPLHARVLAVQWPERRFEVTQVDMPDDAVDDLDRWRGEAVQTLAKYFGATDQHSELSKLRGLPVFRATMLHHGGVQTQVIGMIQPHRHYILSTTGKADEALTQRFLDSFTFRQ